MNIIISILLLRAKQQVYTSKNLYK